MMTPAKLRALRLLVGGARHSWKWTTDELIGGRVANALIRDGLVHDISTGTPDVDRIPKYEITEAGRKALFSVDNVTKK